MSMIRDFLRVAGDGFKPTGLFMFCCECFNIESAALVYRASDCSFSIDSAPSDKLFVDCLVYTTHSTCLTEFLSALSPDVIESIVIPAHRFEDLAAAYKAALLAANISVDNTPRAVLPVFE